MDADRLYALMWRAFQRSNKNSPGEALHDACRFAAPKLADPKRVKDLERALADLLGAADEAAEVDTLSMKRARRLLGQ